MNFNALQSGGSSSSSLLFSAMISNGASALSQPRGGVFQGILGQNETPQGVTQQGAIQDVGQGNLQEASQKLLPKASLGNFRQLLNATLANANGDKDSDIEQQAKDAAQKLVSTTLLMPLFKELRNDPFRSPLMHGGPGEDAFGGQLDQLLADQVVKGSNFPLVDQITQRMTSRLKSKQAGFLPSQNQSPIQSLNQGRNSSLVKAFSPMAQEADDVR